MRRLVILVAMLPTNTNTSKLLINDLNFMGVKRPF